MIGRIRNWLIRKVYPFGVIRQIRSGPLRGYRYVVSPGMGFTFAWNVNGQQWSEMAAFAGAGACVYDVGANRGQSTLHLAHTVGPTGKVIAFEPMPDIFADLVTNLSLNGLSRVIAINAAAAELEGTSEFLFDPERPTQGKLASAEPTNTLSSATSQCVRLIRLDDYEKHGWPAPTYIKIDVEGGAGIVLEGAQALIGFHRPTIFIELHGPDERDAVVRLLNRHGYVARTVSGENIADPLSVPDTVLVCFPLPLQTIAPLKAQENA
jgi:FkbM family methyltransferase